jgi:AAA15 family ATPase/GTPase
MENIIKQIHINNFKSIEDLIIDDCRRINLFIGYPNVGKSNVLEALGLFSVPFLSFNKYGNEESLTKLVRAENQNELFHNVLTPTFKITTNLGYLEWLPESAIHIDFSDIADGVYCFEYLKTTIANTNIKDSVIKRYTFKTDNNWKSSGYSQLLPPFGENIINVLSYNKDNIPEVKAWIKQEIAKYKLELVLDRTTSSLKVQRRLSGEEVLQLPYSSIADTLQRVIFYKTAIASNKNSVLLFEEPEAHAFPPYIRDITQDIIDSVTNQFFIVTHNQDIVNSFMEYEHLRRETSIYLFDFKNNQTTAKRLTNEEMDEVYNYGEDLFFNIESFLR